MNRRDFLQISAALSMSMMLPRPLRAAGQSKASPLLVTVQAQGGWDVTMVCDPKGKWPYEINRDFYWSQVIPKGGFGLKVAPYSFNQTFFDTHLPYLTVINGVDTKVVAHSLGEQASWTGKSAGDFPSLAALYAAVHDPGLPLTYFSTGGYDSSSGLVPVSRLPKANALAKITTPTSYFSSQDLALLRSKIQGRANYLSLDVGGTSKLRREQAMAKSMYEAHVGATQLDALSGISYPWDTSGDEVKKQAYMVLKAYQEGLLCSANLVVDGFDSHGDNDNQQKKRLPVLFDLVNYLMKYAAAEIDNNIIVVIGSDFARTNGYNDDDGKDHWAVGSYIVLNPKKTSMYFSGNGLVHGQTNAEQKLDEGAGMAVSQVHEQLRGLLDLNGSVAANFPLG